MAKRYIKIFLIIFGIILLSAAFFHDNAKKLPFVLKIVASDYAIGIKAFDELMNRGPCIKEGDEGFSVLAGLTLLAGKGDVSKVKIVEICRGGAALLFPKTGGTKGGAILEVTTNTGQTVSWNSADLKSLLEKLGEDSLFGFGVWLFVLGFIFEAAAAIWEISDLLKGKHASDSVS